ncbi:MAG: aminotransferase class III-fold pyridoxal phosphate-dependent enzyme, partial [Pseudomonadota bacterium]
EIWTTLTDDPARWYTSGFTYSGHPVSCAAALKNIEIIEREDLLGNTVRIGAVFQEGLRTLNALPLVGDVRGEAMIACVENVADKATGAKLPEALDVGRRVAEAAQARGLFVRPIGHLNVMSPALVLTAGQAEFIIETLSAAIVQVTDDLVRDGIRIG